MANMVPYNGLDEWAHWADGTTFKWMLLKSDFTPDFADHYVADISAHEITASGYARQTVDTPVRSVNGTSRIIMYNCASISLGTVAAGQTYRWLACFKHVTNDADSPIVGYWDLGSIATAGVPVQPAVNLTGTVAQIGMG